MKKIKLHGKYGENKNAFVDDEDYNTINQYKWYVDQNGYAKYSAGLKTIYMHRLINPTKKGIMVDHIDRNRLNNTRANLRNADKSLNMHNRAYQKNSTTKVKGVYWYKNYGLWESQIQFRGKKIRIGYFRLKSDAASARYAAETQLGAH